MTKLRVVGRDEAPIDAALVEWAEAFLENVKAGNVQGAVIAIDTGDTLDFDFHGSFDTYALAKFTERRFSDILDEVEDEGDVH